MGTTSASTWTVPLFSASALEDSAFVPVPGAEAAKVMLCSGVMHEAGSRQQWGKLPKQQLPCCTHSDRFLSPGLTRFLKLCRGGGTHSSSHPLRPQGTALSHEDAELPGVKRQALLALTEQSCGQWKVLLSFCLGFSSHQGLLALTGHSLAWVTCGLPQGQLLVLRPNCLLSQARAPAPLFLLCC